MFPEQITLSEYRALWLFAMFDLPVKTKQDKKVYAGFRDALLREGFLRMQFSVYARYCASDEASQVYRRRVRAAVPEKGQVRMLAITDRQFAKMEVFDGKRSASPEEPPPQLLLF